MEFTFDISEQRTVGQSDVLFFRKRYKQMCVYPLDDDDIFSVPRYLP